jgi:hypothetical protein
MTNFLSVLNYTFVLLYGVILSFSFTGAAESKEDKKIMCMVFAVLGTLELIVYLTLGQELLFKIYPFLVHIPLMLFLIFFLKKPPLHSLIAVLTAYLLCTPRKWIGSFAALLFGNAEAVAYIAQIIITIPLIYIICRYFSPFIAHLKDETKKTNRIFVIVPSVYYIMEYLLTVYSQALYKNTWAVAEFLDSSMVVLYFLFTIAYVHEINQRKEAEMDLKINMIKSEQAEREIDQLKKYYEQAVVYRHDLLHHLNYLYSCIENKNTKDALSYINEIRTDVHNHEIETFCENNAVNLILTAYITKARDNLIKVETDLRIPSEIGISVTDLCTVLANAMDNAIHACKTIEQTDRRAIQITARMQINKLFIKIQNPFDGAVEFEGNMPKAKEVGHGIGTRSIALIARKYNGLFHFEANDGVFTLTIAL